jgi:hypothetical protein
VGAGGLWDLDRWSMATCEARPPAPRLNAVSSARKAGRARPRGMRRSFLDIASLPETPTGRTPSLYHGAGTRDRFVCPRRRAGCVPGTTSFRGCESIRRTTDPAPGTHRRWVWAPEISLGHARRGPQDPRPGRSVPPRRGGGVRCFHNPFRAWQAPWPGPGELHRCVTSARRRHPRRPQCGPFGRRERTATRGW